MVAIFDQRALFRALRMLNKTDSVSTMKFSVE